MQRVAGLRSGKVGEGRRSFWVAAIGALLLLWPVAINGYPLLFFDTTGYLQAGTGILRRAGLVEQAPPFVPARPAARPAPPEAAKNAAPAKQQQTISFSDARSPYYGLPADILRRIGGLYLIALAQAIWLSVAIVLAMRHTGPRTTRGQLGVLAAVAVLGGAAFGASVILPDMAGGVLLLGMAVIAAYAPRLSRGEWVFWLLSILAAIIFHKAFFALAAALFIASVVVPGRPLWRKGRIVPLGATLALSALLTFGTEPVIERVTGVSTPKVPFLLGRLVEDGAVPTLLREECPSTGWLTCSFLPGMPMTANQFIWDGVTRDGVEIVPWNRRTPAERARISAEAGEIVRRAVLNAPFAQVRATSWNIVDQFVSAGVTRYDQSARLAGIIYPGMPEEVRRMQAGRLYERPSLIRAASVVMVLFTLGSALFLTIFLVFRWWTGRSGPLATVGAIMVVGTALNAAIGGGLVVISDRYQGRLAWTLLFAALVLGSALLAARRTHAAYPLRAGLKTNSL